MSAGAPEANRAPGRRGQARSVERATGEALAVLLVAEQPGAHALGGCVVAVLVVALARADRRGLGLQRADALVDHVLHELFGRRDRALGVIDEATPDLLPGARVALRAGPRHAPAL